MRNLKKFLALVLAMMMVFSLMVTANAATNTFTDAGEVSADYETAANVLTALGVLKGYDDGSFQPEATIKRTEYATILYRIHSGDVNDEKVGNYAKYANFSDITKGAWYEGAVGYVQHEGLMVGVDDNNFGKGNITVVDATVSLLRALGYDQNGEYEGADYKTKAIIDASAKDNTKAEKGVNILSPVEVRAARQDATRQMIAQLAFKTLQAPMVVYDKNKQEYSGSEEYTLGTEALGVEPLEDAKAVEAAGPDYFGRPKVKKVWVIGDEVIPVEYDSELIKTFTEKMDKGDAAEELEALGVTEAKSTNEGVVYYNGTLRNWTAPWSVEDVLDTYTVVNNSRVEVYAKDGVVTHVIVSNIFAYQLTEDDIVEANAEKKVDAHLTVKTAKAVSPEAEKGLNYPVDNIEDYKVGDVVLWTLGYDQTKKVGVVDELWKATPVVGKLTKISSDKTEFTINGNVYTESDGDIGMCGSATASVKGKIDTTYVGQTYTYYIGANNAIVHVEKKDVTSEEEDPTPAAEGYAVILAANAEVTTDWKTKENTVAAEVFVLTTDGETETYTLDVELVAKAAADKALDGKTAIEEATWCFKVGSKYVAIIADKSVTGDDVDKTVTDALVKALDGVYTYSVEDGKITLKSALGALEDAAKAGDVVAVVYDKGKDADGISITSASVTVNLDGKTGEKVADITSKTVFVLSDGKGGYVTKSRSELGKTDIQSTAKTEKDPAKTVEVIAEMTDDGYVAKYIIARDTKFEEAKDDNGATDEFVFVTGDFDVDYDEENDAVIYTAVSYDAEGNKGTTVFAATDEENEAGKIELKAGFYYLLDDGTLDRGEESGEKIAKVEYLIGEEDTVADGLTSYTVKLTTKDTTYSIENATQVMVGAGVKKLQVGSKVCAILGSDKEGKATSEILVLFVMADPEK